MFGYKMKIEKEKKKEANEFVLTKPTSLDTNFIKAAAVHTFFYKNKINNNLTKSVY